MAHQQVEAKLLELNYVYFTILIRQLPQGQHRPLTVEPGAFCFAWTEKNSLKDSLYFLKDSTIFRMWMAIFVFVLREWQDSLAI
jgi:hypothetical protein